MPENQEIFPSYVYLGKGPGDVAVAVAVEEGGGGAMAQARRFGIVLIAEAVDVAGEEENGPLRSGPHEGAPERFGVAQTAHTSGGVAFCGVQYGIVAADNEGT